MAKRKRAARRAARQERRQQAEQLGAAPQGGLFTNIDRRLQRQQNLLSQGKFKKAAKVGRRISNQLTKNPQLAMPVAQQYAQDEFQQNLMANRPNQETIGGSRGYSTDEFGNVIVTDKLDEGQQGLYNQQIGNIGAANQAFANAFAGNAPAFGQAYDFSQLPQAPQTADLAAERSRIEGTIYDRNKALYDQSMDRERQRIEDQLASRGNVPGTPAYDEAMRQFQERYDAGEAGLRQDAVSQAGSEFERSFNIGTQGRANALQEMQFGRQQPLQELQGLAGLGGGPTMLPNFFNFNPVQYQGPQYIDYLGAGIEQNLAQAGLNLERQALNRVGGGGGGGYGGAPAPAYSLGGLPPSAPPAIPSAPNPFIAGFVQGAV